MVQTVDGYIAHRLAPLLVLVMPASRLEDWQRSPAPADMRLRRRAILACRGASMRSGRAPRATPTTSPVAHDQHAVAEVANEVEVMADHDEPDAPCASTSSLRMLSTCMRTVTSSADVGSSAMIICGFGYQHHCDHDALAHAAGYLVRIEIDRHVRDRGYAPPPAFPAFSARACCARCRVMHPVSLGDLMADPVYRD